MYHCHFEDVEHVQMGMTGHRVRPADPGRDAEPIGGKRSPRFAYNDGDGSTGYHRHFAILLNEIWSELPRRRPGHPGVHRDRLRAAVVHPERTVLPADGAAERRPRRCRRRLRIATPNPNYDDALDYSQPNSALVQVQPGRAGAAAAGQPRLPAARDAAARASRCTCRPGRLAAAQRQRRTPRTGPTRCTSARARRATCCSTRPAYNARRARPASTAAAATTSTTSRTGTGAGCPTSAQPGPGGMMTEVRVYQNAAARPDRREPDLCLSGGDATPRQEGHVDAQDRRLARARALAAGSARRAVRAGRRSQPDAPADRHGLHARAPSPAPRTRSTWSPRPATSTPRTATASSCGATPTPTRRTTATSRAPARCCASPRARPSS